MRASRGEHAHSGKLADMREHLYPPPAVSASPGKQLHQQRGPLAVATVPNPQRALPTGSACTHHAACQPAAFHRC